jgi:hypothetical protein
MRQFMHGEIDALNAVAQIKALPQDAREEYMLWPEGTFARGYIEAKIAELHAAWGPDSGEPAA